MGEFSREYLELLAEKYPNEAAVCSEIINLNAILTLPKGTEHFISDLHGSFPNIGAELLSLLFFAMPSIMQGAVRYLEYSFCKYFS